MRQAFRAMYFGLARALGGLTDRPLVSLLAMGAIGVSFLLLGVVVLAHLNISGASAAWGRGVQMVVYLDDETPVERARAIGRALLHAPGIERVDYVPSDEAYRRLVESLGDRKDLLSGVEIGYLPASLEVTLGGGVRDVAKVSPLVDKLRRTPGIEEVEFLGDWVDRLTSLLASIRSAAWALALLALATCVYVVASTIKLSVHARKDEIEILKLVGATDRFVKLPLLVEGAVQGLLGSAVALGLLYAFYRLGGPPLARMLSGAVGELQLSFLSPSMLGLALLMGTSLGMLGSFVAIGRHADA
ncbi:MAG: hypothetical protein HY698_16680 [Deltaproteobacteria bacterium]|nr:hypothetical protein [Deltaproteobacteria bacterium]